MYMKKHKLLLMIASLILTTSLFAEEERIVVGTAPETIEIAPDFDSEESGDFNEEFRSGFQFDEYPPMYYPFSCHWISKISAFGDSLEIEDGSVWELDPTDGYKALHWRSRDPLVITQNRAWFSEYNYRIINKTKEFSLSNTSRSVTANLKLGPFENGEYTNFIAIMDRLKGELALTDSTNLEVCPRDRSLFRNWKEGQAIIIGVNSGWESSYDLILINVNTNNFVRAKQF